MLTPNQTITTFLCGNDMTSSKDLEVAIVFAESMIRELTFALREWEAEMRELEDFKRRQTVSVN